MKPLRWKKQIALAHYVANRASAPLGQNKTFLDRTGWMPGQKSLPLPVAGELFLLTSPFIELLGTWRNLARSYGGAPISFSTRSTLRTSSSMRSPARDNTSLNAQPRERMPRNRTAPCTLGHSEPLSRDEAKDAYAGAAHLFNQLFVFAVPGQI